MLRLEIVDETCGPDEAHMFDIPTDTNWFEIQQAVMLLYPTVKSVYIHQLPDVVDVPANAGEGG